MAETDTPTTTTDSPLPAPALAPPAAPVLKPGWQTSEAWLSFLTIVIGAIPSSGLVDNSPVLAKVVGMAIAVLAALNYTAQRTALKRAHLAALAAVAPPQVSRIPQLAASALVVAAVLVLAISQAACGTNCKDPKNAGSVGCVVEGAVVDCTGVSSLSSAVTSLAPVVEKLLASARQADGSINWAGIESQLVDLALQYGTCTLAEVWNIYVNGVPAANGIAARTAVANKADFAAAFDRIRAKTAPGRKFKTSGGAL